MKKKKEAVIVRVYNEEKKFDSRKKALAFFSEGLLCADAGSSEWCRYATICYDLQYTDKTYITDDMK